MLNTASFFDELGHILKATELSKEAGFGRDFKAWVLKRHRNLKQVANKADNFGNKVYTKLPRPVQKAVTSPTLMDPSDSTATTALGTAARMAGHFFKGGSAQSQKSRR